MKKLIPFLLVLSVSACRKEEKKQPDVAVKRNSVYVINEGNFQWGNSSLTIYDPESGEVIGDAYRKANNRPLGDVFQSITSWKGRLYLVVNNSGKIEECDPVSLKSSASNTGFVSPRYLCIVSDRKAFVSDLYDQSVKVWDPASRQVIASVPCVGWKEQMLHLGSKVYVTNLTAPSLYAIDTGSQTIDSLTIGFGSNSIAKDKDGLLWLACKGNSSLGISPSVTVVRSDSFLVERRIVLPFEPSRICVSPAGDLVYFIHRQDVVRMDITATAYKPEQVLVPSNGRNFYGLGIDPQTGDLYVSDARDFVQKGEVLRYNSKGELLASFETGIIPTGFYFGN